MKKKKKAPSFFTFFSADYVNMKIPKVFTQCVDEPFPERVFLRDRNNHMWIVEMEQDGHQWSFVKGWNKFVNDNSLTKFDLLVFQYVHKNIFNVKLYGTSATEKNIIGPCILGGVNPDEEEEEEEDDSEMTESENYNQQNQENVNNEGLAGNNRHGKQLTKRRRKCYGMDIFEAGQAKIPKNPYFVAKFKPTRRTDLFIPSDVINDYGLTFDEEIILVDPEGREFTSYYRKWEKSGGRSVLSRGWIELCLANQVTEHDKCICEFVPREGDNRHFLHVSFVRSNM
ncbi:hypothetical protein ACS0TY_001136 [Phlomoides rotata]